MDREFVLAELQLARQEMMRSVIGPPPHTSNVIRAIDEMISLINRHTELHAAVLLPDVDMLQLNAEDVVEIAKQKLAEELAQYILDSCKFSIENCAYAAAGRELTASIEVLAPEETSSLIAKIISTDNKL